MHIFYSLFLSILLGSFTHAMELEKQQTLVKQNNYVLGKPTLFDRLPAELRAILARMLVENDPEIARYCWEASEIVNFKDVKTENFTGGFDFYCPRDSNRYFAIGQAEAYICDATDGTCIARLDEDQMYNSAVRTYRNERTPIVDLQGTKIVTFGKHCAKIWRIVDGSPIAILSGHTAEVRSLAFNSQGTMLASGSEDTTIKLWDAETGTLLCTLDGHTAPVRSVSFNAPGSLLVSASDDGTSRIWNVKDGTCQLILSDPDGQPLCLGKFNIQSTHIVMATRNKRSIKVWDIASGQCIKALALPSDLYDDGVSFTATGKQLLIKISFFTVIANISDMSQGFLIEVPNNQRMVLSRDGTMIAVSYPDNTIKIFRAADMSCMSTLIGHTSDIVQILWNTRQDTLVTCGSNDRTIFIWNVASGSCRTVIKNLKTYATISFNKTENQVIVLLKLPANKFEIYNLDGNCCGEGNFQSCCSFFSIDDSIIFCCPERHFGIVRKKELTFAECVMRSTKFWQLVKKKLGHSLNEYFFS